MHAFIGTLVAIHVVAGVIAVARRTSAPLAALNIGVSLSLSAFLTLELTWPDGTSSRYPTYALLLSYVLLGELTGLIVSVAALRKVPWCGVAATLLWFIHLIGFGAFL